MQVYHNEYKKPIVLVEVIWGQQGWNFENLLNAISQEGKLGQLSIWYLGVPHSVEVKGHLGSSDIICENLANTISEDREAWRDLMFSIA